MPLSRRPPAALHHDLRRGPARAGEEKTDNNKQEYEAIFEG
jgi:hypothetical protein